MFNTELFQSALETSWLGHSFRFFEEIQSTNNYLKQLPGGEISHGMVCLADYQSKGRGQYERNWDSQPGVNLTFTLCFIPGKAERLHVLTLTGAWALREVIGDTLAGRVTIKWPNDVNINEKKVAGLLTETIFNGNRLDRVLVGIGINVNQTRFEGELEQSATSLKKEKGETVGRERFLAAFLSRMEYGYQQWHKHSTDLIRGINRNIEGYGKWIHLVVDGEERADRYKFIGVNENGRLLVIDTEGEINTFSYEQIRLVTD